jgi:ABC-type branched-subunit amino acid transport system ATPase component
MIKSLRLKNFKLFKEAEIPLERFTVFVGPNSTGKTTILEAIYRLTQLPEKEPGRLFRGGYSPGQIQNKGCAQQVEFGCDVVEGRKELALDCRFRPLNKVRDRMRWMFRVDLDGPRHYRYDLFETPAGGTEFRKKKTDPSLLEGDFSPLSPAFLARLNPHSIIAASDSKRAVLRPRESGRGISSVIQELALKEPSRFRLLQESVKSVIPYVSAIRMEQTTVERTVNQIVTVKGKNEIVPFGEWVEAYRPVLDMQNASGISSESISEGTLLVIGVLTLLIAQSQPRIVLIDGIERGLHPKAMGEFIKVVRQIMQQDADLQIIATSHSPYLVDHLTAEELRLVALGGNGYAQVGKLEDHPDFERWRDAMTPGEFWSSVGEKWVTAKRKPSHA